MLKPSTATKAEQWHSRTIALLETLSGIPGVRATRGALLRAADAAFAINDAAALAKLHREVKLLAESLRHSYAPPDTKPADVQGVRRAAAGPGLPGWGQPARRATSWHRDPAPIQYPYGEPPTGGDKHRNDYAPPWRARPPSAEQLARVQALRQYWRLEDEAEYEYRRQGRRED